MLEISHLSKRYKNSKFYSVKDLSFTLKEGEIFGFLGKNGAGKSTTIKCITGILPFEEGKIKVCGYDIAKNPIEAKLNIGYVPDNHAVYENLTGREYVNYMGNIYRVPKEEIVERTNKFAKLFSMEHAMDNQIRSYSHGMHQKICIIAALIHNPKFWVLDEPLMGLDPQSTFEIREYMKEHKKLGNTVFFSSHNIDMVEKLCDRVAIMNRGQLMEIIDVKKFMKESKVPLEEYFLNMTRDQKAKVVMVEDKKTLRKNKKAQKKTQKDETKQQKREIKQENKAQRETTKEHKKEVRAAKKEAKSDKVKEKSQKIKQDKVKKSEKSAKPVKQAAEKAAKNSEAKKADKKSTEKAAIKVVQKEKTTKKSTKK